ncbi:MAG: hypothetical protein AAFQ43_12410, partial [Bacteroidota bacterium]
MRACFLHRCLALAVLGLLVATAPEAQTLGQRLGVFYDAPGTQQIYDMLVLTDGRTLIRIGNESHAFAPDGSPLGFFRIGSPLVELSDGRILMWRDDTVYSHESDGTFIGVFAEDRDEPGAALQLTGGDVLVAEYGTDNGGPNDDGRVSRFAADGTPLGDFSNQVLKPVSLAQHADGRVHVGEDRGAKLTRFSP